jgi:hypothetical protein
VVPAEQKALDEHREDNHAILFAHAAPAAGMRL